MPKAVETSGSLQIFACETPAQQRAFENAAEDLWGAHHAFVPPYPGSVARFLNPCGPFFQRHGKIRGFLATKNGRIVGRIAAILNRTHNLYHRDQTGFFGFPAIADNPEVAAALFETAAAWLRSEGCTSMRGPYNPTINDECGLLLDSFDMPPFIGMTWNPQYLPGLLDACGFSLVRQMHALLLDLRLGEPERVRRIRERIAHRNSLTLRHLRLNDLREEAEILARLYNETLDRNWGFVPISYLDLLEAAQEFRAIADPELILIAEQHGKPAAFAISFPDFHQVLLRAKKWPRILRIPLILALLKFAPPTRGRLAVLGVAPRFRDRGLTGWLFGEQQRRAAKKFRTAEISWVEANNTEILQNAELMGCKLYRTYGIYEKAL